MSGQGERVCDDDSVILWGNSREERLKNLIGLFPEEEKASWVSDDEDEVDGNGRHSMTFEEYISHWLDMIETDGFDIQDYSKVGDPGVLVQFYYPPEKPVGEESVAEIQDCSCRAIAHYNREHNTRYGNVHVLKANSEVICPYRYYITFQAVDEKNNEQTFQARVNVCFPKLDKVVELVRIKLTAPNPVFIPREHLRRGGQSSRLVSMCAAQLLPGQCP